MLTALLCGVAMGHMLGAQGCQRVDPLPTSPSKVRMMYSDAPLIRLAFPAGGPVDFTVEDTAGKLRVLTHPSLRQGEDFEVYSLSRENGIPSELTRRNGKRHYVGLRLLPGRSWLGESGQPSDAGPVTLYVVAAFYCAAGSALPSINVGGNSTWVPVAQLVKGGAACPKVPALPGAGERVTELVSRALAECRAPRVVKSSRLDWRRVSSLSLLTLEPPVLLVDGSDQSLEAAARSVDVFLGPHSVLEVVWEPYSESEPRWWVLVPRPQGMPGHLFAMIDALQWHHPFVAAAERYRAQPLCNETLPGCVPGW